MPYALKSCLVALTAAAHTRCLPGDACFLCCSCCGGNVFGPHAQPFQLGHYPPLLPEQLLQLRRKALLVCRKQQQKGLGTPWFSPPFCLNFRGILR